MSEKLKIIARGQGPELVLIHGWAMHSGIWGGVVDALATEFRINLVDLPGHGFNRHMPLSHDLNTVAELILSELPAAAWLGWSLGGLVTLAAALQQPDKVKKIVLVAATPSFSKQPGWDCGVNLAAQQGFTDGLENDFEGTLKQFCLQTFGATWLQESVQRLGGASIESVVPAKDTLHTGLHLLYSNNLLPGLNKCTMPALILGGTRDRTVRSESFLRAASMMPDARAVSISGAGHAPFISHEEAFLEIIHEFLLEESIG